MVKNKLAPFVAVYRGLLKDKEWRALSNSAKVTYLYLRSKFNKKTLSEVTLSYSEMNDLMAPGTLSKSLKELQQAKFIKKTKHGGLMGGLCKYKFIGEYKDFVYKGFRV